MLPSGLSVLRKSPRKLWASRPASSVSTTRHARIEGKSVTKGLWMFLDSFPSYQLSPPPPPPPLSTELPESELPDPKSDELKPDEPLPQSLPESDDDELTEGGL